MHRYDLQTHIIENILRLKITNNKHIYNTDITQEHHFIVQFADNNIAILKEYLDQKDNIEIVDEIHYIKVILHKPVYLEFNLIRQQQDQVINDIRKENSSCLDLLLNLEKRFNAMEKQLSYGVILPGYKSVLTVNMETLYINFVWEANKSIPIEKLDNNSFKKIFNGWSVCVGQGNAQVCLGNQINPYWFDGYTLEPIRYLKGLKRIFLRHMEDTVTDISPIYHCSELTVLRVEGFPNLKTIDFTNWPKLKLVILYNLSSLEDIKTLEKIDIDELCILNCPKLLNVPTLALKVKIEKQ